MQDPIPRATTAAHAARAPPMPPMGDAARHTVPGQADR
jgi:hypothetical protein